MVETVRRPTWGECGKERVFMQIVGRKLLPKIANKALNVGPMFSGPRNRSDISFWEMRQVKAWQVQLYKSKNKNTTKTKQRWPLEYILHQQVLHQKYQRTSSVAHLPHNPPFQISPLGLLDFFLKHHLDTALYQLTGLCGMLWRTFWFLVNKNP